MCHTTSAYLPITGHTPSRAPPQSAPQPDPPRETNRAPGGHAGPDKRDPEPPCADPPTGHHAGSERMYRQGVGEKGRGGHLHPKCCDWRTQQSSNRHRQGVLQVPRREKHLSGS